MRVSRGRSTATYDYGAFARNNDEKTIDNECFVFSRNLASTSFYWHNDELGGKKELSRENPDHTTQYAFWLNPRSSMGTYRVSNIGTYSHGRALEEREEEGECK